MDQIIQVNWNGKTIDVRSGITLQEFFAEYSDPEAALIVAGKVDNRIRELTWPLESDCAVEPIDVTTKDGERIYVPGVWCLCLSVPAGRFFPTAWLQWSIPLVGASIAKFTVILP
jgi:hypothetical protein